VHEGEFVQGSFGRDSSLRAKCTLSVEQDEDDSHDPVFSLKPSAVISQETTNSWGGREAPAESSVFDAAQFLNPYSFASRAAVASDSEPSDSDASLSPPLTAHTKLPHDSIVTPMKLPALNALRGLDERARGPLLSGYDSWSDNDADGVEGSDEDEWSDQEAPQQQQQPILPQKLSAEAAAPRSPHAPCGASSSPSSAAERVESWASRHAGGGLLRLMLHMRRCSTCSTPTRCV
jgi:hypothetical protein